MSVDVCQVYCSAVVEVKVSSRDKMKCITDRERSGKERTYLSQKRLIDFLCRLGCCLGKRICCCQNRLEIVNCLVLQDVRSCNYLLSCQHLLL